MDEQIKLPPHSLEAEQSVLGALLNWADTFDEVGSRLQVVDFYSRNHRIIYEAILTLADDSQPYDLITVGEWLKHNNPQEDIGLGYLGQLAANTPSSANLRAYADIVINRATERRMIAAANEISGLMYNSPDDTETKIVTAQRLLGEAIDIAQKGGDPASARQLLTGVIDEIDRMYNQGEEIKGLSTGLTGLDDKTGGLQDGDLIIVAGRPSMGKTALATNAARFNALDGRVPVLIFSLEMEGSKLLKRELSSIGQINHFCLRNGKLDEADWGRLTRATSRLAEAPLFIDDSPNLTLTQIRAKARRMHRKHGIGLIVVDYLQLITTEHRKNTTRDEEVSTLSRGLKNLARELKVPIVVLSQLNRGVESRPNKRPRMADLRDSGAIEQDADIIVFVYRDEVYNEGGPYKGLAELIVGKNRDGETGTVRANFSGGFCEFTDFVGDWPAPEVSNFSKGGGFQYSDKRAD